MQLRKNYIFIILFLSMNALGELGPYSLCSFQTLYDEQFVFLQQQVTLYRSVIQQMLSCLYLQKDLGENLIKSFSEKESMWQKLSSAIAQLTQNYDRMLAECYSIDEERRLWHSMLDEVRDLVGQMEVYAADNEAAWISANEILDEFALLEKGLDILLLEQHVELFGEIEKVEE